MPDNARRTPARTRQEGRRSGQPPRRGGDGGWRGSDGTRRTGGSPQGAWRTDGGRRGGPAAQRPGRSARPPQADPYAGLDRALSDAAAQPAPAAASFAELGLPERLISALAVRDIHEPFAIQSRALPDALAGRDVLGRAQTGSGKTLAFGLAMLTRLAGASGPAERRDRAPRGLVLVPTRELAQQVADVLTPLGRSVGVSVTTVYGGVPIGRQITRVRDGVDIVVATPGRLIDLLDRGACTLAGIEITVIDEADHMADLGFLPAVTRILDETPAGGQRLLFSATLDKRVGQLVTRYLSDPALHAVAPQAETASVAEHSVLVLDGRDKLAVAAEIASRPARTLFFVRTKHGADRLARQLTKAGVPAEAIHGNRNQSQRQRALDAFAAGRPAGAGRHRRRGARHPRGRRGAGRALRPAERPQGLPAPVRPDGSRRGVRAGRHPGRGRPGAGADANARRGRRRRAAAPRRRGPPPGPGDRHDRHAGTARPAEGPGRLAGGRGPRRRKAAAAAAGGRPDRAAQ